ncbi:MAG TPA: hypothetical protein VFV38_16745 [Ktedonobacteraceae bacterium]|nr:hypothetical protein [Ktedonobacteraceae bacterium]
MSQVSSCQPMSTSSISPKYMTMDIHSHILPGMQQEAMNKLSKALESTKTKKKKRGE